jgi:hypothetical protein
MAAQSEMNVHLPGIPQPGSSKRHSRAEPQSLAVRHAPVPTSKPRGTSLGGPASGTMQPMVVQVANSPPP